MSMDRQQVVLADAEEGGNKGLETQGRFADFHMKKNAEAANVQQKQDGEFTL